MQVNYKISDRLQVSVETRDIKGAFAFLGACDNVLGTKCCGNCGSERLRFQHRRPKGYDYYSIVCEDCGHELKFGQQKETGDLFPKGWEEPYQGGGGSNGEPATAGAGANGNTETGSVPW